MYTVNPKFFTNQIKEKKNYRTMNISPDVQKKFTIFVDSCAPICRIKKKKKNENRYLLLNSKKKKEKDAIARTELIKVKKKKKNTHPVWNAVRASMILHSLPVSHSVSQEMFFIEKEKKVELSAEA